MDIVAWLRNEADLLDYAEHMEDGVEKRRRIVFRDRYLEAADEIARLLSAAPSAKDALADMEARKDAAYLERNRVVAALAALFPSGIARTNIPGWSDDWHGCVYIDLPTGQVSWHYHDSQAHLFAHLPPYAGQWDGHDTEEKYRRVAALKGSAAPSARGVVIEACAAVAESWQQYVDPTNRIDEAIDYTASQIAEEIRQLKTASSTGGDQP